MAKLETSVTLDWTSACHFVFGFLAALLGREAVFTAIFLFKQLVDFLGGESSSEVSGDVAEYAAGMTLCYVLCLLLR